MESKSLGGLLTIFITVIIAAVLISSIGDQSYGVTNIFKAQNQSIDFTTSRIGINEINETVTQLIPNSTTYKGEVAGVSQMRMNNGTIFVLDTDYNVSLTKGIISLKNTSATWGYNKNQTYIDFTYYQSTYVKDSVSRTLISLITLLVAIGILGWIAMYVVNNFIGQGW